MDDQALLETPVVGNVAQKVRADQERLSTSANQDSTAPAKVFKTMEQKENTEDPHQQNQERRIVLLGKTGSGRSHLANTIFREDLFQCGSLPVSGTIKCQRETRCVDGRSITLIDTPGFFDTEISEEKMKPEIVSCITECAPGPHAFLIVLKVERFTKHEQEVIDKILKYFSKDALKYAVIVFTHGEDLPDGMKIEEFVRHNKSLIDLVQKCGGRCHVVDNKHWNNKGESDYRSNQVQVKELLNTIDKLVKDNNGGHYTNEMLELAEQEIKKEEEKIQQLSKGDKTEEEIRKEAKTSVFNRFLIQLAGTATGVLLGAFCGGVPMVSNIITALRNPSVTQAVVIIPTVVIGGMVGGMIGHEAAKAAETPKEAAKMAAKAVFNKNFKVETVAGGVADKLLVGLAATEGLFSAAGGGEGNVIGHEAAKAAEMAAKAFQ